jgi:hypothetical protein
VGCSYPVFGFGSAAGHGGWNNVCIWESLRGEGLGWHEFCEEGVFGGGLAGDGDYGL